MRNSVFFISVSFVLLVYVVGDLLFGGNRGGAIGAGARPYWYRERSLGVDHGVGLDKGIKLLEGEIEIEEEGEESLDLGVIQVKHQLDDLSSEVMELHIDQTYLGGL